jgi:hypothetical protein
MDRIIKDEVLITVGCQIFPPSLLSFILNEFCSRFVMAVPFILPTPLFRPEFRRKRFFIRILFQVYFDFAQSK